MIVARQHSTRCGHILPYTYDYDISARHKGTYKYSKDLVYENIKVVMLDFPETDEGK
jgi:hypothetical protein